MQDSPQPMKAANITHASRAWPGGTQRRGSVCIRAVCGKLLIGNDGDRFTPVVMAPSKLSLDPRCWIRLSRLFTKD